MPGPFEIPVIFLGEEAALADRLEACYGGIDWDPQWRIAPVFRRCGRADWPATLPRRGRGLVYLELENTGMEVEAELLRMIRAFNPGLQVALLAEDTMDYFQVAQDFRIGNVLKKGRFDPSIVRALTIRLLTGNIFGFDPYFPKGFTVGPEIRTYSGQVGLDAVIEEAYSLAKGLVPEGETGTFRIFLHELLTNTFAYALEGISPEERDAKLLAPKPEIFIPERKAIKVCMVGDEEKLGFSITDSTGNLSMLRVLQKLRRQSRIAGEKLPPGIWDESGRGMSLVYRYSRFIVNILQGVRTETIFLHYREKELNRYESIIITEVSPF